MRVSQLQVKFVQEDMGLLVSKAWTEPRLQLAVLREYKLHFMRTSAHVLRVR
jgi:hypothetical protein